MLNLPSGTVTFLFTDIEGSTKLAQEYPESWESLRERHHAILQSAMAAHHGYVFQVIGDAFCVAFHTAVDALNAAVKAQQLLQEEAWSPAPIRVRIGINTGTAQVDALDNRSGGYKGYTTLARVQRVMSVGYGGQILLSNTSYELVRGELPRNIDLRDMGQHRLKGLLNPEHLWQAIVPGLQQDFPPLVSLNKIPNNLPLQLTSFIGRDKEIEEVERALESQRLVTLTGPGGTGKTRLSLQVGADLLDQFDRGVWFVELAPILDSLLVPRTTAIALGLHDEPQRPVIDMLCDYLKEKKMLIILDNCEHLVDACAQMVDRILHAAPKVRILASSREALGIAGEVTYRIPSLGLPDLSHLPPVESLSQYEAVKLFIDRATSAVPSFAVTNEMAPFLAQICHRLDGIPLAIELAAAKIRVLPLEQISRRLDDRFKLLTGGSRTALERHQTLRAAIDWSYNLLPRNEQALFRRLSVFVGGWTVEAAETISSDASLKSDDVLDLLEHLINKSLVVLEDARYRMLETIRQYANEKLVESGESDILRDRHLDYFLNLAETTEPHLIRPEQLEWLARLDVDYENLRLALEWSLSKETAEPSLRLCAALGWFWGVRGYWLEGARWLSSALAKPSQPTTSENTARVKALYQGAAIANYLDDLESMQSSAEKSLALAGEASDRRDLAIARFYAGWALERQGDYERAISLMEQSWVEFQEIHELYWESVAYRWLGNRLVIRGKIHYEEKVNHHLELARKAGERMNLAYASLNKAHMLYQYNHLNEAKLYADEANVLFMQMRSNLNELSLFLGNIAWLEGDYKKSRAVFMEIRERFGLLGEKTTGMIATASLGCLAFEEGDFYQAHSFLEKALETAREIKDKEAIVWRLAELGNACLMEGKVEEYQQNYRESLLLAKDVGLIAKRDLLLIALDCIHFRRPETSVYLLGAIFRFVSTSNRPISPIMKRSYDRAKAYAHMALDNPNFEAAFVAGQKMSLDEALDLAWKTVEEIEQP